MSAGRQASARLGHIYSVSSGFGAPLSRCLVLVTLALVTRLAGERRDHEVVEVAVEHRLRVRGLDSRAQVFDHLIGLQHIRADLVAPTDIGLLLVLGLHRLLALA